MVRRQLTAIFSCTISSHDDDRRRDRLHKEFAHWIIHVAAANLMLLCPWRFFSTSLNSIFSTAKIGFFYTCFYGVLGALVAGELLISTMIFDASQFSSLFARPTTMRVGCYYLWILLTTSNNLKTWRQTLRVFKRLYNDILSVCCLFFQFACLSSCELWILAYRNGNYMSRSSEQIQVRFRIRRIVIVRKVSHVSMKIPRSWIPSPSTRWQCRVDLDLVSWRKGRTNQILDRITGWVLETWELQLSIFEIWWLTV